MVKSVLVRPPLVYITCLIFLCVVTTVSFGKVLMLIDDEDSINLLFDDAKYWDETANKNTKVELLAGRDPFTTKADRKGAAVAFRGPGNAGNDVGYLARSGLLNEGFALITKNPAASNEFRYFTVALKHDGTKNCMLVGIIGFPGSTHGNAVHPNSCWDHRFYFGKHGSCADWNNHSFPSITVDTVGNDLGDTLPTE